MLLQATGAGWTAIVAWRRRGLAAVVLWMAVLSATYVAVGSMAVLEPWGPHVAPPFFVLFCCLIWLISGDDLALLPPAAAVGSLLVQTHVGYAPLVTAGVVFVIPAIVRASGHRWRRVATLRPVRWAAAVGLVLWLPPLVETVRYPPGNLLRTANQTVIRASSPKVGIARALEIVAAPFRPIPGWLGGRTAHDDLQLTAAPVSALWLLVPATALIGAGWLARRSNFRDSEKLVALAGAMALAGVVAVANVQGDLHPYLFFWREAVAALTCVAALSIVVRALAQRHESLRRAGAVLGAVAILVASGLLTHQIATAPVVLDRFGSVTQDLLDQLEAHGELRRPTLVRVSGSALGGVHGGLVDELARRGAPIRVDDGPPFQYGHDRTARVTEVSTIWYVAEDTAAVSLLTSIPDSRILAQHHVLSPTDHDLLTTLQRKLARQITTYGEPTNLTSKLSSPLVGFALSRVPEMDQSDLDELSRLNQTVEDAVCECAVVAVPASYTGPVPGPSSP